jgi:single-strand DNA-binding protein
MNDIITVRGIVATDPRHLVTEAGLSITSIRLASPSRRWDRQTSGWTNGPTNWFTVTAFRSLATNTAKSLTKGDRVIVTGRLRVRSWERENRSGTSVEIDAEGIGHDLAWGVATWMRMPRNVGDARNGPGEVPHVDVDPSTGEVRDGRTTDGAGTGAGGGAEPADVPLGDARPGGGTVFPADLDDGSGDGAGHRFDDDPDEDDPVPHAA